MKFKDIVLIITGVISAGLVAYFSFIEPVVSGISKYGLPGFIAKAITFVGLFVIIAGIAHYNE